MLKKLITLFILTSALNADAQEKLYHYDFFVNSIMEGNYFFSKTYSKGNSFIAQQKNKLPVSGEEFFTPGNSLRLQYTNGSSGNWKATVFHQEKRGMDFFTKPAFLSFHIKVETDSTSEKDLPVVRFQYTDSSYSKPVAFQVKKTKQWENVLINTGSFGSELLYPNRVIAIVFEQQSKDGKNNTIYIDDIGFVEKEFSGPLAKAPQLLSAKGYAKHVDIAWQKDTSSAIRYVQIYRSDEGSDYNPVGIKDAAIGRYSDYTGETGKKYSYRISYLGTDYKESPVSDIVAAATRTMTDDELLDMVQEASFRYYWESAESFSGLAKENIPGRQNMIASGAAGFGLMAIIAATERKFITRDEAVERFVKVVNFLTKAEKFHGAFPHFINGQDGKVEPFFGRKDNGADLVETAFLMEGLLTAKQYFSADNEKEKFIRDKISDLWLGVEWDWFKQYPNSKFLYWHWSPDKEWVINHKLIGWNETMVTYLLAIASPTHGVPASMYYSGWANQDSTGQQYRSAWGGTTDGSKYSNGKTYFDIKLDVGVSNGGPLFFTHYSYMGYDPAYLRDKYTNNYFINNQNIAKINHAYCVENPKKYRGYSDSAWGLTASDGPFSYSADEPTIAQDHGKIAPTGAIASFPYTPAESMKALKNYYYNYGKFLWGEYGFKDAFDLTNNWCSEIYMGLNQAPMTVMIENYRTGLIWKMFMKNPEVMLGLMKLDKETAVQKIRK